MAKRSKKLFPVPVCLVRRASACDRANPIRMEGENVKVIDHFTHLVRALQQAQASPTGFIKKPCRCKDQVNCPDLVQAEVSVMIEKLRTVDPSLVGTLQTLFTR